MITFIIIMHITLFFCCFCLCALVVNPTPTKKDSAYLKHIKMRKVVDSFPSELEHIKSELIFRDPATIDREVSSSQNTQ